MMTRGYSFPVAIVKWVDSYSEAIGKTSGQVIQDCILFFKLHNKEAVLAGDRLGLCERLVKIDEVCNNLGKQITQDEYNELKAEFDRLGGTMKTLDKVIPMIYVKEFTSPMVIVSAKKAIFEQVLRLKKEESEILERLSQIPDESKDDSVKVEKL